MDIGPTELIIALVIILLLFGGKKLPEIARGLGRAQHEFKEGMQDTGTAPSPSATASTCRSHRRPPLPRRPHLPGNNDSKTLFNWSRPNRRT